MSADTPGNAEMLLCIPNLSQCQKCQGQFQMGMGFPFMIPGLLKGEKRLLGSGQGIVPSFHGIGEPGVVKPETIGIGTAAADKGNCAFPNQDSGLIGTPGEQDVTQPGGPHYVLQ